MNPLTDEQRQLAEQNHNLVHSFLKEYNLPESQYYDIVIFGYLCAVQDYCENDSLKKYSFTTIAWKCMKRELSHHHNYLKAKKNAYETVSLFEPVSKGSNKQWQDVLVSNEGPFDRLNMELLLHDLATKLPRREMRIIRMKLHGDKMHDIAKSEGLTFKEINRLLNLSYNTIVNALWG